MSDILTCKQFGNFLARRTEHLEDRILEEWFPTQGAWVGQVSTGRFASFQGGGEGYEHTYDEFHVAAPDLRGTRKAVKTASCDGQPCNPTEKKIGMGTTRRSFGLKRESVASDKICWDQNIHIDNAKEQWARYVEGLRASTEVISADWIKTEALRGAVTLQLAGVGMNSVNVNVVDADGLPMVLDTGGQYPTSLLTMKYLMRFVEPLMLDGYFQKAFSPQPVLKLITDQLTSYSLSEGNATLSALFRFDDFQKGGALYKIGATSGVGNFVFSIDYLPLRFNKRASDGKLVRVYPYENVAATTGIKRQVSTEYLDAEFQLDFIWHPMAMEVQTMDGSPIHSEMPFMVRGFAGDWRFAGPDSDSFVIDNCVIDNKRRNQGVWFADFETATKYQRPKLIRAILHLRKSLCNINEYPCEAPSAWTAQSLDADNAQCAAPSVLTFTPILSAAGGYRLLANTATLNGNTLVHDAITGGAAVDTLTELVAALNTTFPGLDTWAEVGNGTDIKLTGSNAESVGLPWVE